MITSGEFSVRHGTISGLIVLFVVLTTYYYTHNIPLSVVASIISFFILLNDFNRRYDRRYENDKVLMKGSDND